MFSLFIINIKLALLSVWSKKIRSALTILGIIIGVYAITTLLGVGEGVKQTVTKQVQAIGTNVLFVVPGQLTDGGGGFNPSASIGASTLTEEDLDDIRAVSDVVAASPVSLASGLVKANGVETSSLLVLGTSHENDEVRDAEIVEGRFISPEDESAKTKVAVFGSGAAERLFPDGGTPVGKTIVFRNVSFEVVGVFEQTMSSTLGAFSGPSFDDAVYFPFSTLADVTSSSQIFRIGVKASGPDRVAPVKEAIDGVLTENHGGEKDFSVLTQDDFLEIFNSILGILTAMVSAIASISLLVGGIGIMNIMLVSVTERTKEIGLRKAIGAGAGDIFLQFLTEAMLLSLGGGGLGILLSFLSGRIIEARTDIPVVLTLQSVGLAVAFSVLVGVFFGVAPAIRASRFHPIQALKYE